MSVVSCTYKRDCPGSDFPITNYSAEGAEQFGLCFSLYFPQSAFDGGCISVCAVESNGPTCDPATQNAADICALQQAAECPPGSERHLFCNVATTCSCVSAGNAEFFYTTPAGTFCAETQEAADALAHSYACSHCSNPSTSVQIGALDACTCLNHTYAEQIGYAGQKPIVWAVTSGALPDGLILNTSTGVVSGTTTVSGEFTFTITAYLASGDYGTRTMTISVIEITTTSLPDFELGVPYSAQLTATGGSGNYAWKLETGTLPTGLTLFASGAISGTPTAAGSAMLKFSVIDLACDATNREFFIPQARVTGKSTTTIAEVKGFSEFYPFASTPPKKYMVRTYSTSMTGTDAAGNPVAPNEAASAHFRAFRALGPAIFDLATWYVTASGHDQINAAGQTIANASVQLYTSCPGGTFAPVAFSYTDPPYQYIIRGWCFPYDQCTIGGVPVDCAAAGLPPPSIICGTCSNPPVPVPGANLLGFSGDGKLSTAPYNGRPVFTSATHGESNRDGMDVLGIFGSLTYIPSERNLGHPTLTDGSYFGEMFYKSAWSVDLSVEYTDALALANATVYHSNGLVAQNKPRTFGFVSTWTTVDYTVHCSNLLAGEDYVAIVYLRGDDGSVTTIPYAFTATGPTHDITASVPTPPAGQNTIVRGATISYATP